MIHQISKREDYKAATVSILLNGCTTWTLTKRIEKKLDGNCARNLGAILNKSGKQHPTKQQLYGHLPPVSKTLKVRQKRHTGHCWRSKEEVISDVLQWIPSNGLGTIGRQARNTSSKFVRIQNVICGERWRIGTDGEREQNIVRKNRASSAIFLLLLLLIRVLWSICLSSSLVHLRKGHYYYYYYYYYYYLLTKFFHINVSFHWRLSDSKVPRVSRTLLSRVFNTAVVWMVSTRPPTSKSSRPFNKPLVTVPKAPITIVIIVTFLFHSFFFNSLARSKYLSFFSHSFSLSLFLWLLFYSLWIFYTSLTWWFSQKSEWQQIAPDTSNIFCFNSFVMWIV